MNLGITGANGFVAWHLKSYLKSIDTESVEKTRLADKEVFANSKSLEKFVSGLDFIIHLAGVNRASDEEIYDGNILPARLLVEALAVTGSRATLLFASSTHAVEPSTIYGEAKLQASDILRQWSRSSENRFINMIIPHVYGEYCKPFYNSGVASFCYQIINDETLDVNPGGRLELVHVQDLVEQMIGSYSQTFSGNYRIEGHKISVRDVVDKLNRFHDEYVGKMQIPDLGDQFSRNLFNTFRSYIIGSQRNIFPPLRSDDRGWLVETVKAGSGGQCFVSSTHPGIIRGNHYHRRKVERFFVLKGQAEIKLRKLFTEEVTCYHLNGMQPSFIDIPTLHTHSIKNIGDDELITLFWADEFFDPDNPDTFYEEVE